LLGKTCQRKAQSERGNKIEKVLGGGFEKTSIPAYKALLTSRGGPKKEKNGAQYPWTMKRPP